MYNGSNRQADTLAACRVREGVRPGGHVSLLVCRSDGLRLITLDDPMPYEPPPVVRGRPAYSTVWDS